MKQSEIIAENLKRLLKERNKKATDMAKATGISTGIISGYMNAKNVPRMGKIQQMADYLGVNTTDITNEYNPQFNIIPSNEITTVPIIGTIACGTPLFSEENVIGEMEVLAKDVKGGDYFALIAKGDSMKPRIENGDEVLIRKQPVAENGDIVAVSIDGEITLKRFKQTPSGIVLIPENQEYDPIVLSEDSQNYIVGKATKVSKTL